MNPFKYGQIVRGNDFCRRPELEKNLANLIKNPGPEGPALISPQLPARRAYSSERGVELAIRRRME